MKTVIIPVLFLSLVFAHPILAQNATEEGESVLQKVKEKVEALKKNPKAIIGTITDKTDTSIQIKDVQGKIELVSISDITNYSKIDKSETEIKYGDIAIGDYVSVLGTHSTNQLLNARRIILTSPLPQDRKVSAGKIANITKRELTLEGSEAPITLIFPARWKGPEIKEFKKDESVIVVYTQKEGKLTIRTIQKAQANPSD